ncbi:FMN reductase [Nitrobacteraceae bacterium AZCC 2146]
MTRPYIVGLGGTMRAGSSTESALSLVLGTIAAQGADTLLLCGSDIDLPPYVPGSGTPTLKASRIATELGRADGIILGTPGYHGGISGLVKNALDYTEELRGNKRPYLEGRPVGCLVTAAGEQGAVTTLNALRSVVHALRGWPTPLGVTIITTEKVFDADGKCLSPRVETQLNILSRQVLEFAVMLSSRTISLTTDSRRDAVLV